MPNVQQQPIFPQYPTDWGDPTQVRRWGEALQSALVRAHLNITYLLNATIKNSLAADRTTTPDIDEIFAYETDTGDLYIAVDGAWVQVN